MQKPLTYQQRVARDLKGIERKQVLNRRDSRRQVPALDLMRTIMRGLPVDGYECLHSNDFNRWDQGPA
jgi:hypothetical protein